MPKNSKGPKLPVSVDLSAKAELKGEVSTHALDRAVHALVDAVSPFTEGMGLIGDHLRAHRYDVAIRIAQRAQQLAHEQNRKLTPPPLKFTVPFLEKSSTEAGDPDLMEMWARLLVDASDEFHSVHLTFVQVLSEISGFEAKYLNGVTAGWHIDQSLPASGVMAADFQRDLNEALAQSPDLADLRPLRPVDDKTKAERLVDFIYGVKTNQICRCITVAVPYTSPGEVEPTYLVKGAHATTAYLLQRQDLLKIEALEVPSSVGVIRGEVACLTPLGKDFLVSCMGR